MVQVAFIEAKKKKREVSSKEVSYLLDFEKIKEVQILAPITPLSYFQLIQTYTETAGH